MNENKQNAAYQFLNRIAAKKRYIEMLNFQIEELKARAGVQAIRYDGIHVQSGEKGKSTMAECVLKYTTLEQKVIQNTKELNEMEIEILDMLSRLPSVNEYKVLTKRYIDGEKYADIVNDLGFSLRTIRRIHDAGMMHLEKMLENVG